MPKKKTHKGAAKRFKLTATGKVMRGHAYHSHILTKKTRTQKRRLRGTIVAAAANTRTLRSLLTS